MADDSLSNPFHYTICLTQDEYKKHQRLIYIGSVMAQLLKDSYFCIDHRRHLSYGDALREIEQFVRTGQKYSCLWNELANVLYKIEGY